MRNSFNRSRADAFKRYLFPRIVLPALLAALAPSLTWAQGRISTVAGSAGIFPAAANNGAATNAPLLSATGVAADSAGNIYVADSENNMVAKVASNGALTVVAGDHGVGFGGDGGLAVNAQLYSPGGLTVDSAGNLYIAVTDRIRKVTPAGIISTVAGNGQGGFSGDGGLATSAQLYGPGGGALAVDSGGNLYIADAGNNRIRKVTPEGIITTAAGNGQPGFSGDGGPAASAQLKGPYGVAVDPAGNLYIGDTGNNRIRKVTPGRTISTVAGNGQFGSSGDGGPATAAQFDSPWGLALDMAGNLYIADVGNNRIRRLLRRGPSARWREHPVPPGVFRATADRP
jgi:trimeric autotransporter adhesin